MFERDFYPLPDLATRWGCSIGDLLHLGIQDRAQICVNIYGLASEQSRTRLHNETEDARRESAEIGDAFEAWWKRTTLDMPAGIFELQSDAVRFIDMAYGLPFELHEAMKFDCGWWWHVDFDPPVIIDLGHLVMLREEMDRLDTERQESTATKALPPPEAGYAQQAGQIGEQTTNAGTITAVDHGQGIAELFDSVGYKQLEAMFPDGGKWQRYAERADRNGLRAARTGRGLFNPYRAAHWWLSKGPEGWDLARCLRKLANNLPPRSLDSKHLLTGDYAE
jgi:hypothetical protein